MTGIKQYAQRDHRALDRDGGHYMRHVSAMTGEGLHAKSDIAAELAWRDWRIAGLVEQHHRDSAELRRLCAERDALRSACVAMIEWDDRERDHAVDFYARMELCLVAFEKARAALAMGGGDV